MARVKDGGLHTGNRQNSTITLFSRLPLLILDLEILDLEFRFDLDQSFRLETSHR